MADGKNGAAPEVLLSSVITVPNLLSVFRILLVPFFVRSLLAGETLEPLILFFIAGTTDLIDGFLARVWHQRSRLGIILDPMGDKLLITASYILLSIPGIPPLHRIPLWLTVVVFGRDLLIVSGFLWAALTRRLPPPVPSLVGKFTSAFQVGTAFLVLLSNHLLVKAGWLAVFYAITAALTLASGTQYFRRGLRFLEETSKARN